MKIEKTLDGGTLTLKVEGRLDTNTSPELAEALALDGVTQIVFDFSALEYISSAGLRVLMTAQKAMISAGGKMTIAHPNAMVRGVLDMTGMSSIFTIE